MDEYGNAESRRDNRKGRIGGLVKNGNEPLQYKPNSAEDVLMQLEERNVGAVSWEVYKKYLRFAGGIVWAPVILALLILTQANQGLSRIFFLILKCFTLTTPFSCDDVVSWILDGEYYTRLHTRRLHGCICCARYVLLFLDIS